MCQYPTSPDGLGIGFSWAWQARMRWFLGLLRSFGISLFTAEDLNRLLAQRVMGNATCDARTCAVHVIRVTTEWPQHRVICSHTTRANAPVREPPAYGRNVQPLVASRGVDVDWTDQSTCTPRVEPRTGRPRTIRNTLGETVGQAIN
jgi:hypothetical protein